VSTIVIFARAPVAGEVKTRLARTVGDAAALQLYEAFLDDTCLVTQGLGARRVLAVAGDVAQPALERLAKSQRLTIEPQADGDLGARLTHAVATHVAHGPVVVIGSDAPTLPRRYLHQALDALADADVVLGPSDDGGYYLVGARVAVPELFRDVPWSTPAVLATTRARLGERAHVLLPPWYDVDEAPDLERLQRDLAQLPPSAAPATRRALATVLGSPS